MEEGEKRNSQSTVFYYLRGKSQTKKASGALAQGPPIVTVCLLIDKKDGKTRVCRGMSICSPLDNPNKKIGKGIAFGRALEAFKKGWPQLENPLYRYCGREIMGSKARYALSQVDVMEATAFGLTQLMNEGKSVFAPSLTHFEESIIKKAQGAQVE